MMLFRLFRGQVLERLDTAFDAPEHQTAGSLGSVLWRATEAPGIMWPLGFLSTKGSEVESALVLYVVLSIPMVEG